MTKMVVHSTEQTTIHTGLHTLQNPPGLKSCMLLWLLIIFYYTSMTTTMSIPTSTGCNITAQRYSHHSTELCCICKSSW